MFTVLQTLLFLFGVAFILGFLSRDIQTLTSSSIPVADGSAVSTTSSTVGSPINSASTPIASATNPTTETANLAAEPVAPSRETPKTNS